MYDSKKIKKNISFPQGHKVSVYIWLPSTYTGVAAINAFSCITKESLGKHDSIMRKKGVQKRRKGNVGHCSLQTFSKDHSNNIYASFWPKNCGKYLKSKDILKKSEDGLLTRSLEVDIKIERRDPDRVIDLYSLDINKINTEFNKFKDSNICWRVLGSTMFFSTSETKNCSGLVSYLLLAGGIEAYKIPYNYEGIKIFGSAAGGLYAIYKFYPEIIDRFLKESFPIGLKDLFSTRLVSSLSDQIKTLKATLINYFITSLELFSFDEIKLRLINNFKTNQELSLYDEFKPFIDNLLTEIKDADKISNYNFMIVRKKGIKPGLYSIVFILLGTAIILSSAYFLMASRETLQGVKYIVTPAGVKDLAEQLQQAEKKLYPKLEIDSACNLKNHGLFSQTMKSIP